MGLIFHELGLDALGMKISNRFLILFLILILASAALGQEQDQDSPGQNEESPVEQTESVVDDSADLPRVPPLISKKRGFSLGTDLSTSTLVGSNRKEIVLDRVTRTLPNNFTAGYGYSFSERQRLLLEANLSPVFLGGDLSYSYQPEGWDGAFRTNISFSGSEFSPFYEVSPDVVFPNGEDTYLQRFSTGFEYLHRFNDHLDLAVGVNYQNFGFSDQYFGGDRFPADLSGRPLAFGSASGDLYTLNLHGLYQTLDDFYTPSQGTLVRFGVTQGADLGARSTSFTRFAANIAQYIPAPGFNEGEHTVVLNLQAGTVLGEPPQIAGFHLGGASSVRGFQQGGMASGTSFVQASAEYRHFLSELNIFGRFKGDLRAVGFVDYGTVLGTELELAGIPPSLLGRPTDAFGYGLGLQFSTKERLYRLENAWTSAGTQNLFFVFGERF
jgi:outer membrane protein insertion porin family